MKNIAGHLGVAVAGLLSFALTVAIVAAIEHYTGFNLFTLSFWLIVPAGALITGAAAAAGFYYGSLLLHTRPTWFMLVEVVILAAAAMLTIYYIEYSTLYLDDGRRVADFLPFFEYMQIYLTTMEMTIGRAQTLTPEVGDFGYVLAAIQFVGFILGGIFVWLMLRQQAVCSKCGRYVRTLVKRTQLFSTQEEFTQGYDNLFANPVDTPEFGDWLRWSPRPKGQKLTQGNIQTVSTLKGCPHCGDQQIHQAVHVVNAKSEWAEVNALARAVRIPEGIDLRPAFRAA
jgi:ribosomal protein L32